jgi:hypothetical protein
MPDLNLMRRDLRAFSEAVDHGLTDWQADALRLAARTTSIVAPRQSGKSRSLAVLAAHRAFRRPRTNVLIVSAGEVASRRLLAEVRGIVTGSPLLRGSVVDEQSQLIVLSNGSEIRSVPASERQVRGFSVDLLLVDEAALVSDDLLLGAAIPTTAARPDARIVLASSATVAAGAFFDTVMRGRQGDDHTDSFAWSLVDATWIAPSVIEAARASMTEARFRAEYEGVFASGADAVFPRALLDRATADVEVPGFDGLAGAAGLLGGTDWGAVNDRSTLVAIGRLADVSDCFVVACAHAWRSGHPLDGPGGVIGDIVERARAFGRITTETNGLGLPLAQELQRRVAKLGTGAPAVDLVSTSAESKSAVYSALRLALEQGRLVIPASATELLRELLLLRVTMLPSGVERIEAGSGHDDVADGLYLAAGPYKSQDQWRSRLRDSLEAAPRLTVPAGPREGDPREWVETGAGLAVPRQPRLLAADVRPGPKSRKLTGRVLGSGRRPKAKTPAKRPLWAGDAKAYGYAFSSRGPTDPRSPKPPPD